MAYSAGFSPHPKISYVGAAPTGVGSEAEYFEIGLTRRVDLSWLRDTLDAALPDGLDILETVEAGPGSLAERIQASCWRVELPGVTVDALTQALARFLAEAEVAVTRLTKEGRRLLDARGPVLSARVLTPDADGVEADRAILEMVVAQASPAIRPDDVLAALTTVSGLALTAPAISVRLAQGPLDGSGNVGDPLEPDRLSLQSALS
jgi:radical SAM-linked protein